MAAALKLRSHDDETSSHEKQTRDSPRRNKAHLLISFRQVKKMVAPACLEYGISSVASSFRIIPSVEAGGDMSRKCLCSRRWDE